MSPGNREPESAWIQEVEAPAALVSYIYRTCQRYFAKELSGYRLGWGHFAILMAVNEMDGPSQDSIALCRGFDKTMVAKSVVRLEEEGLVQRVTDPEDRRVKRLYLTEKGKRLLPELLRTGHALNTSIFAGFTKAESRQAMEDLRKIAGNVAKVLQDAPRK